jgi:hypothetical protein
MPALGKDYGTAPPFGGSGIISTTFTEECEVVDISNRSNIGGTTGGAGYKQMKAGFTKKTWEIETHDASGLVAALEAAGSGYTVMSVTENISIDGAITFTVTALQV